MNFGASGQAEATVLERKYDAGTAPKKNTAMIAAAAAVIVAILAIGGYFALKPKNAPIAQVPVTTAGTDVTSTAARSRCRPARACCFFRRRHGASSIGS